MEAQSKPIDKLKEENKTLRNQIIFEVKRNLIGDLSLGIQGDPRLVLYTNEELRNVIETQIEKLNKPISFKDMSFIANGVFDSIRGLGILDEIVRDPDITEIMINGHDRIFIEKNGKQLRYDRQFESKEDLSRIITLFVQKAGRSVSESNPIVDTRLEDGSRVNVVMPPVALDGATVTIRRFPKTPMTVDKLIAYGSFPKEVAHVLEMLVKARFNIFVSGGTGSGKTTFLNALSNYIPKTERIITIEDSAELQIKSIPNIVRLETKVSTNKDAKEINIQDLIKSALRMRPDRVVVGEVRGGEALDMLQAMNTGHDGSLSTGHANSAKDMISRLETMVIRGADLPLEAIRQQIASAVDIIIQLSRLRDHSRKTMEIVEVLKYDHVSGQIKLNPIYTFIESDKTTVEKVDGVLTRTKNPFVNKEKLLSAGIYEDI
ncbi:MAG: CpaF family protein [Defluviitaleaceae bacterium]|nr:CpaF family protein [Defluviitaleaceae bacterium]